MTTATDIGATELLRSHQLRLDPFAEILPKAVSGSLDEVLAWLASGVPVAGSAEDGKAVLLLSRLGPFVKVFTPSEGTEWTTKRKLRATLGACRNWVFAEGRGALTSVTSLRNGPRLSPLERTLRLIEVERGDVGVIVVYGVAIGTLSLAVPITAQALVNTVAFGTLLQPLFVLAVLLGAALFFAATLRVLQARVIETLQKRLFVRVVGALAARIPRVDPAVWKARHGPELLNRFFDLFTIQKAAAGLLSTGTDALLMSLVGLVVLAFYHPALLAFDVLLILSALLVFGPLGRRGVATAVDESKAKYAVAGLLEEMTRHPLLLRQGYGAEHARNEVEKLARKYLTYREQHFRIVLRQLVGALTLQVLASVALLGLGGYLVIERQLTIGQLVAAELIVSAVVAGFAKLGGKVETFYDLVSAVDKVGELLDLPGEAEPRDPKYGEFSPAILRVEDFLAPEGMGSASFTVEPGSLVEVSLPDHDAQHLGDALFGFVRPKEGRVYLGTLFVHELPTQELRRRVSLVRRAEVMPGTILENLRIARPDLTRERAWKLLEIVALAETLRRERDGLDLRIDSDMSQLTTTQMMQITIARALATDAELIILDRSLDGIPRRDRALLLASLARQENLGILVLSGRPELDAPRVSITSTRPQPSMEKS